MATVPVPSIEFEFTGGIFNLGQINPRVHIIQIQEGHLLKKTLWEGVARFSIFLVLDDVLFQCTLSLQYF